MVPSTSIHPSEKSKAERGGAASAIGRDNLSSPVEDSPNSAARSPRASPTPLLILSPGVLSTILSKATRGGRTNSFSYLFLSSRWLLSYQDFCASARDGLGTE